MTRPSHGAKPIGATAFADRGGEELGWVMAGELVSGDLLADIDGGAFVKVVSNALTETQETVYNFEVDSAHSYFVDELGLWAHNALLFPQGSGSNLLNSTSLTPPRVGKFMFVSGGPRVFGTLIGKADPCRAALDPDDPEVRGIRNRLIKAVAAAAKLADKF